MNIALTLSLSILSLLAALFIVRRFRTAPAAQRRQILWAACGAVAVAAAVYFLSRFH